MCSACFRREWRKNGGAKKPNPRTALICGHTDRKHFAHGLCERCYNKTDAGRKSRREKMRRWREKKRQEKLAVLKEKEQLEQEDLLRKRWLSTVSDPGLSGVVLVGGSRPDACLGVLSPQ